MLIPNTPLLPDGLDKQATLKGWPAGATQGGAGIATCHKGFVQYAMPDSNKQLVILTASLDGYKATHQLSDLNNWTVTKVAEAFPKSMKNTFNIENLLSVVSLGDYNYFFWSSVMSGDMMYSVLRTKPGQSEPAELARINLSEGEGEMTFGNNSNLSCFALPDYFGDMAGKIGCVVRNWVAKPDGIVFRTFLLDPAAFAANSPWPVIDLHNANSTSVGSPDHQIVSISAGWVNQGEGLGPDGTSPVASASLVISCGKQAWYGDLFEAFSPAYNRQFKQASGSQTSVVLKPMTNIGHLNTATSPLLLPAPDGELLLQFVHETDHKVVMAAFVPPQPGQPAAWVPYAVTQPTSSQRPTSQNTPCSVFIPLKSSVGPSPVALLPPTTPGQASLEKQVYPDCELQNYVQCTFTSSPAHLPQVVTAYWGCFFTVVGYDSVGYTGKAKSLVSLIADTFPYPCPDPVVWGGGSPSGMVNWAACTYEYLAGNETAVDIDYTMRSSVGMKFESSNLVVGVGVRAEGSLAEGFSQAAARADTKRRATTFSVITKGAAGSDEREVLPISTAGTFFGTPPPSTIFVDAVLVLKRGQADISGTMANLLRPTIDTSSITASGHFDSYLYTPGLVQTYQEAAVNQTAATWFEGLDEAGRKEFTINGTDYAYLYARDEEGISHYLDKVVEAFGVKEFGPDGNLPYLEFAFSEAGTQRSEFQATSAFRAGGSTFVDNEQYGGVAWGIDTDSSFGFLGIFSMKVPTAAIDGYVIAGTSLSTELSASQTASSEWGVQLSEYLNPLTTDEAYSVRMYILQPSPLWARELRHFGLGAPADEAAPVNSTPGDAVDTVNSAPVRILFTVPYMSKALSDRMAALAGQG